MSERKEPVPQSQIPLNYRRHGILRRGLNKLGSLTARAAGLVLVATGASVAWSIHEQRKVDDYFGANDEDDEANKQPKKKYVLVLPFHRLRLVEQRKPSDLGLGLLSGRDPNASTAIEVKELVEIIHSAAADPNICALHGDFGQGMRQPAGFAHIEEIRNAIRVFNESHRVHRDPNVGHNRVFAMPRNGDPKPSYAFGHSFQWNEYFLASAFTHVHLQARGSLNLFGVTSVNIFLRPALEKYGIKAHVFKHGDFKTAANIFTEKKYSKPHIDTVKSMTHSLNHSIQSCIASSRSLNFDNVMWQSIFEYGSLTATNSQEIGLVDSLPAVDPLQSLLDANKDTATKEKVEKRFGPDIGCGKFTATDMISLEKYKKMIKRKKRVESRSVRIKEALNSLSERSTATSMILSSLGFDASLSNHGRSSSKDKVAVITVDGAIGSAVSNKVIASLKKIKKDEDVRCLVLRVNSPGGAVTWAENLLEEIKDVEKPVVCSMSNSAASGGYYIATTCEKIFAQPTSLTGSIGVFGLKFDATDWAKSYGIEADHYPRGSHGAAPNPLTPLTPAMKDDMARTTLGIYDYFKFIVAEGRGLSVNEVETIAQGRVWTGEQAKEVGLVDELGGLDRAIAYAKATHTKTDDVQVDYWPKKTSYLEDFPKMLLDPASVTELFSTFFAVVFGSRTETISERVAFDRILSEIVEPNASQKPHLMLAMDEKTALDLIAMGE